MQTTAPPAPVRAPGDDGAESAAPSEVGTAPAGASASAGGPASENGGPAPEVGTAPGTDSVSDAGAARAGVKRILLANLTDRKSVV